MTSLTVYTDGSCRPNPGRGGWAYVALLPDCEIHESGAEKYTTNNRMELTAVLRVLEDFTTILEFTIYTDSLYVINCATGKWSRSKNEQEWTRYTELAKNKRIKYLWIKGHSGDRYNELVDKLAKEAAMSV